MEFLVKIRLTKNHLLYDYSVHYFVRSSVGYATKDITLDITVLAFLMSVDKSAIK